ncbi:polysaccharide deacetylase family protein [Microseira sp. BLCC-F43]|uniref:polysaccharide deacetylase family protein n=1 Tax=Microseira sp. BLCC-F43 TaxID=3153602 RepID=UPI0035BAE3FE
MVAVPLLVTVDVEIAPDHDLDEQSEVLDRLRKDLHGFPVTWFCTAVAAEKFSEPLQRLAQAGHEIGCHGLDHSRADDYRHMTVAGANSAIAIATHRIATATGQRPRCFRGPRMTTSRHTQSALIAHGYQADFSVCAQRMDLLTCGGAEMLWLFAPRGAYHPAVESPFRRGELPIWVVNLSSLGVPFLSGMLYLAGLGFMRSLFLALLAEARRTGRPIVYLFHSYEFAHLLDQCQQPLHQRAYISNRVRRYDMNLALLNYMCTSPDVHPMTASMFLEKQQ